MSLSARTTLTLALPLLAAACTSVSAQTNATALNWQAAPLYQTLNLTSGFQPDPYRVQLSAGGGTSASVAGANCTGFVNAEAPDIDLNYTAGSYPLVISAEASADTTLVVYDPNGVWHCNDDFSASSAGNPGLTFLSPTSGNYNIWVGTFEAGTNLAQASLVISEQVPSGTGASAGASSAGGYIGDDIQWGDDGSQWSHDGECDDPRFAGPGVAVPNIDADRYHDASDCRTLYQQGQIYLQ